MKMFFLAVSAYQEGCEVECCYTSISALATSAWLGKFGKQCDYI
jgi:hypothetical protein